MNDDHPQLKGNALEITFVKKLEFSARAGETLGGPRRPVGKVRWLCVRQITDNRPSLLLNCQNSQVVSENGQLFGLACSVKLYMGKVMIWKIRHEWYSMTRKQEQEQYKNGCFAFCYLDYCLVLMRHDSVGFGMAWYVTYYEDG